MTENFAKIQPGTGDGKRTLAVMCSPHKHENLSLVPITQVKTWALGGDVAPQSSACLA